MVANTRFHPAARRPRAVCTLYSALGPSAASRRRQSPTAYPNLVRRSLHSVYMLYYPSSPPYRPSYPPLALFFPFFLFFPSFRPKSPKPYYPPPPPRAIHTPTRHCRRHTNAGAVNPLFLVILIRVVISSKHRLSACIYRRHTHTHNHARTRVRTHTYIHTQLAMPRSPAVIVIRIYIYIYIVIAVRSLYPYSLDLSSVIRPPPLALPPSACTNSVRAFSQIYSTDFARPIWWPTAAFRFAVE